MKTIIEQAIEAYQSEQEQLKVQTAQQEESQKRRVLANVKKWFGAEASNRAELVKVNSFGWEVHLDGLRLREHPQEGWFIFTGDLRDQDEWQAGWRPARTLVDLGRLLSEKVKHE